VSGRTVQTRSAAGAFDRLRCGQVNGTRGKRTANEGADPEMKAVAWRGVGIVEQLGEDA
jgi:hypothetical protein